MLLRSVSFSFFFFNDTATTEIYTLSLHDALPIWRRERHDSSRVLGRPERHEPTRHARGRARERQDRIGRWPLQDRKSTRLNSSHSQISYAVFCLKKKKTPTCAT